MKDPPRTHFFTVRVWREELGDGRFEWRGKVQYVPSGEVDYFNGWQNFPVVLCKLLGDGHDEVE